MRSHPAFTVFAIVVAIIALLWDHFWGLDTLLTILLASLTLIAGCVAAHESLPRPKRARWPRALRSESLRGASAEAALDCIVSIDGAGVVREWNDAAVRTFGYPRDALGPDLAT